MVNKFEKDRYRFLKEIKKIITSIKYQEFGDELHDEVYFSGRDEDLLIISFNNKRLLIEISIELTTHCYKLTGNESFNHKFFRIDNNKLVEDFFGNIFISNRKRMTVETFINIVIEKIKEGVN